MWPPLKADIKQGGKDLECIIPIIICKNKMVNKGWWVHEIYYDSKPLYLETDASGVGLGAALLLTLEGTTCQKGTMPDNIILWPTEFAWKSVTSTECRYSNIWREVLGILHGLEKFHHYCSVRDVNVITDHKPLVTIFKKTQKPYHNESSKYF